MAATWKEELAPAMAPELAREIDVFESQVELCRQGKIDEKIFAETRLRRGVYGQRYDNGQRHDGMRTRTLNFPRKGLAKGPGTEFDAPGMMRIKIPFGALTPRQLEVLAEIAEEYSNGILHVTTRQDIQYHFVHLDDTPDLMRRLASVGITTREACGNSVRNVTACQVAGVCPTESFDVSPYAHALADFLLGHDDAQDFGRKFKVAFSGCQTPGCGLSRMHDLGYIARIRREEGPEGPVLHRGFEFFVGGGLGAVPQQAKVFDEFLPEAELLPTAQAVCRVFGRLGEKKNRARARLKFLVNKLGLEEFRRLVLDERAKLPEDPRWLAYLADIAPVDAAIRPPSEFNPASVPAAMAEEFQAWRTTNVEDQRQAGYAVVTLALPLGDLTSEQTRRLADVARKYVGNSVRLTVEQNIVLRWVPQGDLLSLYQDLRELRLHRPGAGTIIDVTSCPGTDTCKLGISSSRGLAWELSERLAAQNDSLNAAVRGLRIKVSGCFNSCGQHHVGDLGFLGVSRKVNGYTVPHFQVVLGGEWGNNAGAFGLGVGAVPSKRIPDVVERITGVFIQEREGNEAFQAFIKRKGKTFVRELIQDLLTVPAYDVDRSFYSDWGDPREYTIGDLGVGECAGEVVSPVDFGLQASERDLFESQEQLEKESFQDAADMAYRAMLQAAKTLVRLQERDVADEPEAIVEAFRRRLLDTRLFHDPFAGAKFAHYFLRAHAATDIEASPEEARQRIEEAQLFIEAAHACYGRMVEQGLTQ